MLFTIVAHEGAGGKIEHHIYQKNPRKVALTIFLPCCGSKLTGGKDLTELPNVCGDEWYKKIQEEYKSDSTIRPTDKHFITEKDMRLAVAAMQNAGYEICGRCVASLYATKITK